MRALQISILFVIFIKNYAVSTCASKNFGGQNNACVCNATYCDEFPSLPTLNGGQAAVYVSSQSGKRFDLNNLSFSSISSNDQNVIKITIDPSQTYQTILGFGGAFTEATGFNIKNLQNKATQDYLVKSYYGDEGIGYNMGRVPIASSDFALADKTYDDTPNDFNLTNFSLLPEDLSYKIPIIQQALNLTKNNLKLYASPWSAPGWMKDNGKMTNGGSLNGNASDPNDQNHKTWANYFVKFFEAYDNNSINFWGVTIQNEPGEKQGYPSMIMSATEQRDFLKNFFGPAIRNNPLTKDLQIMIWDFNRGNARDYIDTVLTDPDAAKYANGIAMHWYDDFGWFGPAYGSQVLQNIHDNHPDKWILNTEACTYYKPNLNLSKVEIGNWYHADYYARDIIDDLNHWSTGFVDWNMALNETGEPRWNDTYYDKNETIDAPIIVNKDGSEFYKQPSYYVIGHFSKFLVPNSTRININLNQTVNSPVQGTSFLTPSKQIVTVLYNSDANNNYTVALQTIGNSQWLNLQLEKNSITTLIWNLETTETTSPASKLAIHISSNLWICLLGVTFGIFYNFN